MLEGVCYLGWLGLQSLRKAIRTQHPPNALDAADTVHARDSRRCFVEGLLSNVLNPKTAAFYLAFLPQFISASDDVFTKSMLLASIHYVEAIVWLAALSILFDYVRRFILESAVRRWLDGLCGAVLVGFGGRLALERQ